MPPKLSPLRIPSNDDTTAMPTDLEAGLPQPATSAAPQEGEQGARPTPARTFSLGIPMPSFLRTSNAQSPNILPPPATASGSAETGKSEPSPPATQRRNRAHTVSVSLQPGRSRAASEAGRKGSISGTGTQRTRRGSILGRGSQDQGSNERQRSSSRASRDSVAEPVRFGLEEGEEDEGLNDEVVGMLDCIDTQVSTVNHLQNMTNGLVFPHLPALWNRRPEVVLSHTPSDESIQPLTAPDEGRIVDPTPPSTARRRAGTTRSRASTVSKLFPSTPTSAQGSAYPVPPATSGSGFAAIPETSPPLTSGLTGHSLNASPNRIAEEEELDDDVDEMEKDHDLDRHVRHVLTKKSKKEQAKQMLKGLWTYLKTPMGIITGIYGFLVVFWGAAIVLFLLGWIPTNSKNTQDIWVEISSQVVNGLFTVTGVGLIPWRAKDTYRMVIIWRLKRKVTTRRKEQGLEPIPDPNDIPDPAEQKDYVSVLSEYEQARLLFEQEGFAKSQTWYKPHATATHKAFPISWALWNTLLMDGNSFFQCLLCGTMWGLNRHQRPAWTTGCLIPLSFLCGIGAAVLIWQGSARTKKRITVEDRLRSALGVHLAIGGIPQTKDGTIITSNNRAATSPSPPSVSGQTNSEEGDEKRGLGEVQEDAKDASPKNPGVPLHKRRTTVTFGSVPEKKDTDARQRGRTVAAPGGDGSGRPFLDTLGPVVPRSEAPGREDGGGDGGVELKEIASRPRVVEGHQDSK